MASTARPAATTPLPILPGAEAGPDEKAGSKVNLVFELPPDRFARCGRAHTEQNAGIPFETAGPEIRNSAKQLGADPVVLGPVRIEPLKRARVAIGLKT